jgi:hypothetical protein
MRFDLAQGVRAASSIVAIFLLAAATYAQRPQLISSIHIDLDDCDDIAVDAHSIYLACHSTHTPGVAAGTPPNMDGFVARIDRTSGKMLYLVRLGGAGLDIADRLVLDHRGFVYTTGFTGSRDFPVSADAVQKTFGGGENDAFLSVIDPGGNIVYSSYLGGTGNDQGDGIAWARNGDILVGGTTWSIDFPFVKSSFGPHGKGDAFVARLLPGSTAVTSAVVLGGTAAEKLTGIAVSGKDVFLTGYTESSTFPATRAFKKKLDGSSDAFLARMSEDLNSIGFATFLGGSGDDSSWGVAVDSKGNPVLAGITDSDDLPTTPGAPQPRRAGKSDAFVVKLDGSGEHLLFSTFFGGTSLDQAGYDGQNVAVSNQGVVHVVGLTTSHDLAVPGAFHARYGGGEQDGFLAAFSPRGKLCYGSYAGGTARYLLEGVTLADNQKVIYAVGTAIPPVEPKSPKPDPNEKYGSFVIAIEAPKSCQ